VVLGEKSSPHESVFFVLRAALQEEN